MTFTSKATIKYMKSTDLDSKRDVKALIANGGTVFT